MWKRLLIAGIVLLVLGLTAYVVYGQDNPQFEEVPIITTATDSVGLGTYVAAEAYAVAAGEDPAAQPMQAIILPYGIYPNMQVHKIEDFKQPEPAVEGFTFEWSLEAPEGSKAEVVQGTVGIFMADVEGEYNLTLTATDANGNSAEATWTVWATTYIGSGYHEGGKPDKDKCADCHDDVAAAWAETGHATFFTRAIDGLMSNHYGPNCISCHTTGFNNRPEAVNGGFDDVAAEEGWTFPEKLEPGNWTAMQENFPKSAALANIQCESCHGPGKLHVDEGSRRNPMIGLGLDYGTCAQCHAEDPYHVFPQQWENSAHATKSAEAFWYPIGEERQACVGCHSGAGYIDRANGLPQEEWRNNYQVITCAVCHDPHSSNNPNQLRVFDKVQLPTGYEVTGAGPSATCMSCHNTRRNPVATVEGENFGTPHYSSAAEMMYGQGGYTWGMNMPSSTHGRVVEGECIGCHMAPTPGMNNQGTDDTSDDTPLPGHNLIGGHTFAMKTADGVENVAVCQQCHDGATSFEFEAKRDYDGDGTIETNQEEVAGLVDMIQTEIVAQGVKVLPSHPYFTLPDGASVDLKGAVYNLKLVQNGGTVDHNLRYTVSLLQLSYEKLTGSPVPNAFIIPPRGEAQATASK